MEEQTTWKEAFKIASENLAGTHEEGKTARLLFVLIFLAGIAFTGFCYRRSTILLKEKQFFPSVPPTEVAADKQRLDNMVAEVRKTSEARVNSAVAVRSMRGMEKYVFADPLPNAFSANDYAESAGDDPLDYPPEGIVLRAVMVMGKQSVAVMDIPGAGSGLLLKTGDTFMDKRGRVVRITPDKVVLNWGGKNLDVVPGF
jgi:Tfp pilus assembly protein PilP